MDRWDKSQRDRNQNQRCYRENPSFSSTLLDAIYRSIDEGETEEKENQLVLYRETMKKQKQSNLFNNDHDDEAKASSFRRSRKVENWMDARVCEKVDVRRNSIHSSSSSTDSSSNGGFSSSESSSELFHGVQRLKPIRTSVAPPQKPNFDSLNSHKNYSAHTQKPKQENGFEKKTTKSKALRRILYGDLKKSKQPISPGAKLASFLNSLFNSGGGNNNNAKKKPKVVSSSNTLTQPSTTCSSASSFSRSCLSKTPSSSRSAPKANRSVRFCPVSVIVDEDCRPCGHKNLYEEEEKGIKKFSYINKNNSNNEELKFHVMEESRRVEEYARDLLRNYQKKKEDVNKFDDEMMHYGEDVDDDDAASCSSSDLFELENLSGIGNNIERYREELPVYETTHFSTKRAISNNGFML